MKKLFVVALVMIFATNAHALGRREEGAIIGLGSAFILHEIFGDRNGSYGGYGGYGTRDTYGYGDYGREFPPFRCRGDSVRCAYERGVWEREREIWQKEKDNAYRCGRYGECE